jgi:hypothetical protein
MNRRTLADLGAFLVIMASLVLITLTLAGCGDPPIAERVKNRDECEAAGGVYSENHAAGFGWNCDLGAEN